MESGIMRVVFSSIINGNHESIPANKAGSKETGPAPNAVFKPRIRYSRPKTEPGEFKEKCSREVFASLNASNCANLQNEKALDGYVTVMHKDAFLKKYR